MQLAIIGLPFSGKTTVFNAATRGAARVAGYSGAAKSEHRHSKGAGRAAGYAHAKSTNRKRPRPPRLPTLTLPAAPDGLGTDARHIGRLSKPASDCRRSGSSRARLRRPVGAGWRRRGGRLPRRGDDAVRAYLRRSGHRSATHRPHSPKPQRRALGGPRRAGTRAAG